MFNFFFKKTTALSKSNYFNPFNYFQFISFLWIYYPKITLFLFKKHNNNPFLIISVSDTVPDVMQYIEKNSELKSYLELFTHELSTIVDTTRQLTVFHSGKQKTS